MCARGRGVCGAGGGRLNRPPSRGPFPARATRQHSNGTALSNFRRFAGQRRFSHLELGNEGSRQNARTRASRPRQKTLKNGPAASRERRRRGQEAPRRGRRRVALLGTSSASLDGPLVGVHVPLAAPPCASLSAPRLWRLWRSPTRKKMARRSPRKGASACAPSTGMLGERMTG